MLTNRLVEKTFGGKKKYEESWQLLHLGLCGDWSIKNGSAQYENQCSLFCVRARKSDLNHLEGDTRGLMRKNQKVVLLHLAAYESNGRIGQAF